MQSEFNVKYGMTIFDVAMLTYGSTEYVSKILKDNNISADYNFDANPGTVILFDPAFVIPLPPDIISQSPVIKTKGAIKAVSGQTLFDLVIMTYGTTDLLMRFIQENNIADLNEEDLDQKVFTFDMGYIKDNIYFNSLGSYVISTAGSLGGAADTFFRITSDGNYRITSAGNKRLWE